MRFMIVQMQQFMMCKLLSPVKQVENRTWIKSSAKFVKYVSPVSMQIIHKLSMILHPWFRKFADTDNFPTTIFKISKKFEWCKKLEAHSSVIKLIDLIAEYWTIFDSSLSKETSLTSEASTSYCFLFSSAPIKYEAKALIEAWRYLGFEWSMALEVKSSTIFSNSLESSSKMVSKHLAAASSTPFSSLSSFLLSMEHRA